MFTVTRTYGSTTDYLIGFDPIWGPAWSLAKFTAMPFATAAKAESAMDAAMAIVRPRAWLVPDFGFTFTLTVVEG